MRKFAIASVGFLVSMVLSACGGGGSGVFNPRINPPTKASLSGAVAGVVNQALGFLCTATDPGGSALSYQFDWNNDGAVDEQSASVPSGSSLTLQHAFSSAGSRSVRCRAKNSQGLTGAWSDALPVTITAAGNGSPAQATLNGPSTATTGQAATFSCSATDPEGDAVSYSFDWENDGTADTVIGPFPSGTAGSTSHAYSAAGSFSAVCRGIDSANHMGPWSAPLGVTVATGPGNAAPAAATISGPGNGATLSPLSFTCVATDPDADSIHYQFDFTGDGVPDATLSSALPSGSPGSLSNVFATAGTYQVSCRGKDSRNATGPWGTPLTVHVLDPSQAATLDVAKAGNGQVLSQPSGIDCGATCSALFALSSDVTLVAAAASGWTVSGWTGCDSATGSQCTVHLSGHRSVSTSFTPMTGFSIATTSPLPAGVVGSPYSVAFQAAYGAPPFGWSVVSGGLPGGLNLSSDGLLGGSPIAPGAYSFRIHASDARGQTAESDFSLTINPASPTPGQFTLMVTKTGNGTVMSSSGGINCGAICSATFTEGTVVTLTTSPQAGNRFDGFGGDADCVDGAIEMTANRVCTASFSASSLTVNGMVQFDTGAPAAGAFVSVRSEDYSDQNTGVAASDGFYSIPLSPGAFPTRVLATATFQQGASSSGFKWSPIVNGSGTVQMDTIALPNPAGRQLAKQGSSASNFDGSIYLTNLPAEVASVSARVYDPDAQRAEFPGDFAEGPNIPLNSVVFAWISAQDAAGNQIHNLSSPVTVRMRVPPSQWVDLADLSPNNGQIDVPIYAFEEGTGYWKRQPDGRVTDRSGNPVAENQDLDIRNGAYTGDVYVEFTAPHFSWSNCDIPPIYTPYTGPAPGTNPDTWMDFGDAPAPYPSRLAQNGVRHHDTGRAWLGDWVDAEPDAKVPDEDYYDDGLLQISPVKVKITNWDWPGPLYINILVDYNGDGNWTDPGEWVERNDELTLAPRTTVVRAVTAVIPANLDGWVRVTLTGSPISNYTGTGEFPLGETEDYWIGGSGIRYLSISINGQGTVTSTPSGINCPGTCNAVYPVGTTVQLTASAADGWRFVVWSGDPDCADGDVTLFHPRSCTANFSLATDTTASAKTYGGSDDDYAHSVRQTPDGGFIVVGQSASFSLPGPLRGSLVLKLDANRILEWQKAYQGGESDIVPTPDGGYLTVGGPTAIKLDAGGNLVWQRFYGKEHTGTDNLCCIEATTDGGYVLAGGTTAYTDASYATWILKLDGAGTPLWQKSYRLGGGGAKAIRQTSDGGYIVAADSLWGVWVLKLDGSGNVQWQESFLGMNQSSASSIVQTPDSGYLLAGYGSVTAPGANGPWVVKLNSTGGVVWQKVYQGAGWGGTASSLVLTSDGGFVVTTGNQMLRLASSGDVQWQRAYPAGSIPGANPVLQTADGGFLVVGGAWRVLFGTDFWVMKLDSQGNIYGCTDPDMGTSTSRTVVNTPATPVNYLFGSYNYPPVSVQNNKSSMTPNIVFGVQCTGSP